MNRHNGHDIHDASPQAVDSAAQEARRAQLRARLRGWSDRLHAMGLDGLLSAAVPLAPLGAALLTVAAPALGLVVARDDLDVLAGLLSELEDSDWKPT